MSIKLKNRKLIEDILHTYLNKTTLSNVFINSILSNEVNDDFLKAVLSLNEKISYLHSSSEEGGGQNYDNNTENASTASNNIGKCYIFIKCVIYVDCYDVYTHLCRHVYTYAVYSVLHTSIYAYIYIH